MTRPLHAALLALALTLTACIASTAHGQGWPGELGTLASDDLSRSLPLVGDLLGNADILALELNQQGGATTALCSLKWEALQ